jgi:hypothetical protein
VSATTGLAEQFSVGEVPAGIDIARWWAITKYQGALVSFADSIQAARQNRADSHQTGATNRLIRHAQKIGFVDEHFIGWHSFAGRVFGRPRTLRLLPIGVDKANGGRSRFPKKFFVNGAQIL